MTTTIKIQLQLRVLIFWEGEHWVAQCVDVDIAAQGRNHLEVKKRFEKTLFQQILVDVKRGIVPLSDCGAPPSRFLEKWNAAVGNDTVADDVDFSAVPRLVGPTGEPPRASLAMRVAQPEARA